MAATTNTVVGVFAHVDTTVRALEELRAKGHHVERARGYGGYQGILIDWDNRVLHGATESRKDGVAAGY